MPLKQGEMQVVRRIDDSHVVVDTCREEGKIERGLFSRGDCDCEGADGFMSVGENLRPGVYRIDGYIPYTARGPARVASPAYRSGWDEVFGARARASN
jgi:hypothetical protein